MSSRVAFLAPHPALCAALLTGPASRSPRSLLPPQAPAPDLARNLRRIVRGQSATDHELDVLLAHRRCALAPAAGRHARNGQRPASRPAGAHLRTRRAGRRQPAHHPRLHNAPCATVVRLQGKALLAPSTAASTATSTRATPTSCASCSSRVTSSSRPSIGQRRIRPALSTTRSTTAAPRRRYLRGAKLRSSTCRSTRARRDHRVEPRRLPRCSPCSAGPRRTGWCMPASPVSDLVQRMGHKQEPGLPGDIFAGFIGKVRLPTTRWSTAGASPVYHAGKAADAAAHPTRTATTKT